MDPLRVRVARLGVAEWLMFGTSVGLIVDLFAGSWFSYPGGFYAIPRVVHGAVSGGGVLPVRDGWSGLPWLGPVTMAIALAGIIAVGLQALRRSPAVPIVVITMLTPVAGLLVVMLVIRTLIEPPAGALRRVGGAYRLSVDAGAYVGLGLAVVLVIGLYLSLRRDGIAAVDAPEEIETIELVTVAGT